MNHVLTLVAGPAGPVLMDSTVARVRQALKDLGADTAPPLWLSAGRACDLPFDMLDLDQADAAARQSVGDRPVDVVALPAAGRRKKLLIADMDSTIVTGETLDELAEFASVKDKVAAITARAMNGEIDFAAALRERVAMLEGLPVKALADTCARIALMPGARTLVQTMRAHGAYTALVSGGFDTFTSRVREAAGFHVDLSNTPVVSPDGARLTGRVHEPILTPDEKLKALIRLAAERQLPLADTLAVGDGANDLPMIEAAGLGVAYHAKPTVAARARVRVDHGDLTALLYAQGYRAEDLRS